MRSIFIPYFLHQVRRLSLKSFPSLEKSRLAHVKLRNHLEINVAVHILDGTQVGGTLVDNKNQSGVHCKTKN